MQVDKGAIRFVLSGANIMCPGLTSPGAKMTNVPKDSVVVSLNTYHYQYFIVQRGYVQIVLNSPWTDHQISAMFMNIWMPKTGNVLSRKVYSEILNVM